MRFDTVKIENYRQYASVIFDFEKTLKTDIHIIKASNGVGKTNLLNAINWCLYGDEPHMALDEDTLSICTESVLYEAKENGEDICVVKVTISGQDKDSNITITRSVKVNTSNGSLASKDELQVQEDFAEGGTEYYDNEKGRMRIDQMFPIGIREYFFFDGEQLLNYFGEKTNTSAIKDSIYRLAQINSIVDAHAHLDEVIKKFNREIGDKQPELERLIRKKEEREENLNNKKYEIAALDEGIRSAKNRIKELDSLISGSSDAVKANENRNENLQKIKELEDKRKEILGQLSEIVREYTILLYLYDANKKTYEYILEQEKKDGLESYIDNVDLIVKSLENHRCAICDEKLSMEVEERLTSMVEASKKLGTSTKTFAAMKVELKRALKDAEDYKLKKEKLASIYLMLQGQIEGLTEENEQLTEQIKMCSDINGIATFMAERENLESSMHINLVKKGKYEESLDGLEKEIKKVETEYNRVEQESKINEKTKLYRDFALEARNIISEIETEMVDEVKDRMKSKTMDIFNELIWKKNTYDYIELDSNFKFKLFNKDGKSCFGSCSAAEKELLALAFTIALHEVSGYNNLLFIDTPVGRVSDLNRSNFATVLKEISEHKQIILAFTPSEYSDEISRVLDDTVVSSFNELSSDEISTERK